MIEILNPGPDIELLKQDRLMRMPYSQYVHPLAICIVGELAHAFTAWRLVELRHRALNKYDI